MRQDIEVQHIPQADKALIKVPIDVCQSCWDDIGDFDSDFDELTVQLQERIHEEKLVSQTQWRGFTRRFLGGAAPKFSFGPCEKCGSKQGGDRFPAHMWRRITPLEELANTKGEER